MQDTVKALLIAGDVQGLRRFWASFAPHLPQPNTDHEAAVVLHHARTQSRSVPMRLRAYSHRWLIDHAMESGLPDILKPRAERMYPTSQSAVGISVNTRSDIFKPILGEVQKSMEDSVMDSFMDGKLEDTKFVTARMFEARKKTIKQLLGINR